MSNSRTFVEIVPVFYLTVPIFAAITISFNQSLLHLYVVFVAFAGIGMITPPVCVGIYTSASVIQENPAKAFKEVPLFVGVGILYGILMIFILKRQPGFLRCCRNNVSPSRASTRFP